MESETKELITFINKDYTRNEQIITKVLTARSKQTNNECSSDLFRVETFNVIINKWIVELDKRSKA